MEPSQEMLSGLLAAAPDALLATGADGRVVFVNHEAERLFGWPAAELLGQEVERLVPDRFVEGHRGLRRGFSQHTAHRPMDSGLRLVARRRDGSEFPVEISLSSLSTSEGDIVLAAIRDVTLSRRNEQRFRAVLASAPDAIVGVDVSGRIELLGGQAEQLFGWTRDELLGQLVEVLVPAAAREGHVEHRAQYLSKPTSRPMGAGLQLEARRKDGTTFPAEISLSAIEEDGGHLLVLAAIRDVTDRVALESERHRQSMDAEREQADRLSSLGQLAGGVAHDFNNLLGVILNYCTLLSRQATDATALADIGEIRTAAERAATLTRQLLTFARRDVAKPEAIDVNHAVASVASLLDRTLGEQIELRLALAPQLLVVMADIHQIEQILLNLALNSRDAMPNGGVLTIRTELQLGNPGSNTGSRVCIEVIDTGCGMERDVMARAFEPFFTTKPRGEGTGLGLATVYGTVHQNGGDVAIESSPGKGTRVSVSLPVLDFSVASPPPQDRASVGGKECILVVEDEAALRRATERILVEHGYEVVTAADGLEALEVFDRTDAGRIDLVLTDVAMPRMRGDALAQALLAGPRPPHIIFMTGYDSGNVPGEGRVLDKPVRETELLQTIREVLDA